MTMQDDRLRRAHQDLDETQSLMAKNIADMTDNIAKADVLEGQTQQMADHADEFRKGATTLKRTMWWKNMKMWLIIGGVAAVIIIIIIIIIATSVDSGETTTE